MNLPKTKNELKFENRFLDKIEQGVKQKTIRNSPVELGVYELRDGLSIEVYRVSRCEIWNIGSVSISLYDPSSESRDAFKVMGFGYSELGFNTSKEGQEFYKNYLKHEFCYLIEFRIIKGEDSE